MMIDTPRYKELQAKLASLTDEKARLDTQIDIGGEVRAVDVDQASVIADDVVSQAREMGYRQGLGKALTLKGSCLWVKGEYDAGLAVLQEALAIATRIKDRRLEAMVLYYLGNIYRDMGDLVNVLTHFEKALVIYEELGDEFHLSVILTSISNLLYDLNDYDSALEYALKCLPIFERAHDVGSLINIYNTLGNIYFKKEQFPEALHYFRENISLSEPETPAYVMAESGLGKVYYKMLDFGNSSKYLTNSLREAQLMGNAEVQIICHFYLGRLYMDDGNYRQALQSLNSAYNLAVEYLRRHDIMSIHEMLSVLYDKMGDIPKAFQHLKSFEKLKEDIFKQKIINELRNLQVRQQIELARKEKEVAERTAYLKHQFMANMSHEIRTPMNAIVGMTRLLLSKAPSHEQLRYLNAIQLSANNLLVIINDILDLSKIEAGKIVIEQIDFSIREVIESVGDMLILKVEEKGIAFRSQVAQTIPNRLTGDPTRLSQVLINLAGNAVKFTDKGSVQVQVRLARREEQKLWLEFDVIDTGIGIGQEHLDTIFDSFTQAGSDITRKFGGTGLGLTICKQLVGLMGGEISVKSEVGKGTTFTTVIPFAEATDQTYVQQAGVVDGNALARLNDMKVLLVEDNEFNRMVAEDTLLELLPGIRISTAVNGQDAIDKVKSEPFDIVLMDIQMPVMDGLTATRLIRESLPEPARSVKIIAMTANVLQEDVQLYLSEGMDAFVSKPFNPDELLLKMDAVIGSAAPVSPRAANEKPGKQEPALPPLPEQVTNRQFLQQFTSGNREKQQKYIGMFLDNAPKILEGIMTDLEAHDFKSLKIKAHSLKPQMSYMGVQEEVSHVYQLEQSAGGDGASYETLRPLVLNLEQVCRKAFTELKN